MPHASPLVQRFIRGEDHRPLLAMPIIDDVKQHVGSVRVDASEWQEIPGGRREEAEHWMQALGSPPDVCEVELAGMIASIAHLTYHLGAIRQIDKDLRGPREGTF
jgi:hypothetical protein